MEQPTQKEEPSKPKRPENELEEEGSRFSKEGKYSEAVEVYCELLERKVEEHGELAEECATAYFNYGRNLLLLGQTQFDILGGKLRRTVERKLTGQEASDSEDENLDARDTEENLELAWDILDTARVILSTKPERKLELADVYLSIGDLCLELENFKQSISDYEECLKIRQELLPPEDRRLAETHFSMGLAYQYSDEFAEAKTHWEKALKIFELIISKVKEDSQKDETKKENELKELNSISQELREKIEDLSSDGTMKNWLQQEKEKQPTTTIGFQSKSPTGPVKEMGVFSSKRKIETSPQAPPEKKI